MVCTKVSTTTTPEGRRATDTKTPVTTTQITAHSYKYVNMRSNKEQGQVCDHEEQQAAAICRPLLRLQRTCTNPVSHTTGRTRVQHPTQRRSNNHARARVRRTTETEGRTRFVESRNGTLATRLQTDSHTHRSRTDRTPSTYDSDTNRQRAATTRKHSRLLVKEQPRSPW